jgi:hypothetical protein
MPIPLCEQTTAPLVPSRLTSPSSAPAGETPPVTRWYQLSGADLVFLVVGLLVFLTARQGLLDDPGLGWHLRNIDAMIAEGGWLTTDSFSEPRNGQAQPWRSNQWLGEVPFWLGERWAGLEGIAAVAAIVIAFTLRCLYRMLLRDGSPWPVAVFWISQAGMGISCSWVARPNLFTMLFVLVTARVCVLFHEGRCSRRQTLWLLPLFCLWANTHGGFVAGFIVLGATLGLEMVPLFFGLSQEDRQSAKGRVIHLSLILGGSILATLINPYGLSLYRWIVQLLGEPYFMDLHQEWKSPDFHGRGAIRFELLMLLFPLLLALSKRRPHLVELGLAVVWFHFALTGFRYVCLWVLVVLPLLARSSLELPHLKEAASRFLSPGQGMLWSSFRPGRSWLWSVLFAAILLGGARTAQGRLARHTPEMVPAQTLDCFLALHHQWTQTHGRRAVVFHSYDWGGYLTWHGWPNLRNWIDDRNEVQGKAHIQDYFAILATNPGWEEKLNHPKVDLVCIQSDCPLAFRLAESSHWRELSHDAFAVIFERTD